jgi:hypothetical protein
MEAHDLIKPPISRIALMALEAATVAQNDPTNWDALTTHHFAPGVYARQFDIPKDCMVIGKIHKHAHLNFLMKGIVSVASEFHTETFAAPRIWVSEPGIKRAVLALEDTQWVTVHPNITDTDNLDELEDEVIAPTYEQLDAFLAGQLERL